MAALSLRQMLSAERQLYSTPVAPPTGLSFLQQGIVMQLHVSTTGDIRCVYGEDVNLAQLGRLSIQRGSHVEPNLDGQWTADLSPVHGPNLGPFTTRREALTAEVAWLNEHWLPG